MRIVRYSERPDLRDRRDELREGFPEFMYHNAMGRYWSRLYPDFPEFQLCLFDETGDSLVAEAHAIPIAWDGTLADLPSGWDAAFERGAERRGDATVVCALAISVDDRRRGEGHSRTMLQALVDAARAAALRALIAPVRPTWKARYPLIPIERYMTWRRGDGQLFDPWLRVHEHLGAEILAAAPQSMTIEASARDWSRWTKLELPEDGTYVLPGALAPLEVRDGVGIHVEPNVWMRHSVVPG